MMRCGFWSQPGTDLRVGLLKKLIAARRASHMGLALSVVDSWEARPAAIGHNKRYSHLISAIESPTVVPNCAMYLWEARLA